MYNAYKAENRVAQEGVAVVTVALIAGVILSIMVWVVGLLTVVSWFL